MTTVSIRIKNEKVVSFNLSDGAINGFLHNNAKNKSRI